MLSWWPAACCLYICMTFFAFKRPPRVIICTVQSARSFDPTLAKAPVHVDPGPRSCGRCCGEEPRLAAWTGGRSRRRRKGPNAIHGEPLVLAAVFWIYSIAMLSLEEVGPWKDIKATRVALIPRRGHPPLVLIPWPARVGQLQWPSWQAREAPTIWGGASILK